MLALRRGFDDASVNQEILELQSDHLVAAVTGDGPCQVFDDDQSGLLIAASPDRGRRAGGVSDLVVGDSQYRDLDEFADDDPLRNQSLQLVPQRG